MYLTEVSRHIFSDLLMKLQSLAIQCGWPPLACNDSVNESSRQKYIADKVHSQGNNQLPISKLLVHPIID